MAKVALSKLGLKVNNEIKEVEFNGQKIEVKQYLPFNEILVLIANVINNCQDENNFKNTAKIDCFTVLEMIKFYTNITFTDKQLEDPGKLFDLFISSGCWKAIKSTGLEEDYKNIVYYINSIFDNIYEYRNSAYGILDAISNDYKNLDLDASKIQKKLADGENVEFLKDVLTKLG